jgi:hypothetical protein
MRRAEADPASRWLIRRLRQSTDRPDDRSEIVIVPGHAMLQVHKPGGEVSQVVTSCDHLGSFGLRKLESKVQRDLAPSLKPPTPDHLTPESR